MRHRRNLTRPVSLLVAGLVVAAAAGTGPAWSVGTDREGAESAGSAGTGAASAERIARAGDVDEKARRLCGPLLEIRRPSGQVTCTPGPETFGIGVGLTDGNGRDDVPPDLDSIPPARAILAGIPCEGDGQDGNRVQAVYAYPANQTDRYNLWVESIRQWASDVDAVFQASAARTGGMRRVRFVTEGPCLLSVLRLPVPANGDDDFWATVGALEEAGLVRPDRKYLVWMDSEVLCGQAEMWFDDRPGAGNRSNGRPDTIGSVARIDSPCWGLGAQGRSVEAHELMHLLGGVQPSAPNATDQGHCVDDSDRMCYADGSVDDTNSDCSSEGEALFDCDGDDYFHTDPPPGSYLADHWNTASSSFLTPDDASVFGDCC